MVPTVLAAVTVVFVVFRMVPGDPAALVAGEMAPAPIIEEIREQMGLNKPIYVQYVDYLGGLARGDLGISKVYRQDVLRQLLVRVPATLELASTAVLLALLIGLTAGVVAAIRFHSLFDYASSVLSVLGVCMPGFWLGLVLMMVFAVGLGLLPSTGRGGPQHLALPAVTLSAYLMALVARMTRSSMLDAVNQDYVRTARAKGLRERVVVLRHALRNAMIPTVTVVGLQFGYLLGGSIVVETVFAWPGLGALMIDSVRMRDYTMVQGITLFYSITFLIVNLVTDLLYAYLDPQVRYN